MYTLKASDGSHIGLGTSTGTCAPSPYGTLWSSGCSQVTRDQVSVERLYLLVFPDGHSASVEVMGMWIGGGAMDEICFYMSNSTHLPGSVAGAGFMFCVRYVNYPGGSLTSDEAKTILGPWPRAHDRADSDDRQAP